MRVTTIKNNESDLSALTLRLYPNLSENVRKQVEGALLKENPHLAELNTFKEGIMVRLPSLPDLKRKPVAASDDPVADMTEQLKEAIQDYQALLLMDIKERKEALDIQENILRNKEVAEAIKQSPEAAKVAKQLATSLGTEKKNLEEVFKTRKTLFNQITADLESLLD